MKARLIIFVITLSIYFSCTYTIKSENKSNDDRKSETEVPEMTIRGDSSNQKTISNNETTPNMRDETKSKITFFVIGLIIGAFVVYYYSRNKIYKILKEENIYYSKRMLNFKKYRFFKYIGLVEQLKISKDKKKEEIEDIRKRETRNETNLTNDNFVNMHNNNFSINDMVVEKKNDLEVIEEESPNVNIWKVDEKDNISELFFTIPFEDGSFLDLHKTESKEHNSFYKIKILEHNKGELHFLSSEYDKTALDNISGYLSPVCIIENIEKRLTANRISMKVPGEVILSEGSWMINENKKVIIELI